MDKRALILSLSLSLGAIASAACKDSAGPGEGDTVGNTGGDGVSASGGASADSGGASADSGGASADSGGASADSGGGSDDSESGGSGSGATVIAVVNSGFEAPATSAGSFDTGAPPDGWQPVGMLDFGFRTIGVLNPTTTLSYEVAVPEGMNIGVVFLQDSLPASEEAGMEQTLSETLSLNSTYTLEVEVGNITSQAGETYDFTGFPGYRIELLAGGAVIASDNSTLLPDEGRFELSVISVAVGDAHPNAGERLGIRLMNVDGASGIEVNFDDVRLTRTVQ